jgi:hypothetical protein
MFIIMWSGTFKYISRKILKRGNSNIKRSGFKDKK